MKGDNKMAVDKKLYTKDSIESLSPLLLLDKVIQ